MDGTFCRNIISLFEREILVLIFIYLGLQCVKFSWLNPFWEPKKCGFKNPPYLVGYLLRRPR